ncbi:hypothetical protein CEXT_795121 [Caerostris extrusa]|uniref:Uncharacterized protein n=1 Tax=Caerostris extrusa TaxID=172846 RepID=A0AAV4SDL7_CAEEX|nr:hypothetical protein CEXT_795121 [Caerostris extrusa]
MRKLRASYHMGSEGFTNGLRLPFLKKYSIKCERFRLQLFCSGTKRHNEYATRYCAGLTLQDVLNRRLLFKTNLGSSTKETITHHFFVSELGRRNRRCSQICGGAENVVKTETQQTFKMDCSVLLL